MRNKLFIVAAIAASVLLISQAHAKVINGNFCSEANVADPPAGLYSSGQWNDLTSATGGFSGSGTAYGSAGGGVLTYDDGSDVSGNVSVSWTGEPAAAQNTNDGVYRPFPPATIGAHIDDGHDQLMSGYLQVPYESATTPTIVFSGSGLHSAYEGDYGLVLYSDGDDDVEGTGNGQVTFSVWTTEADYLANPLNPLARVFGRDASDFAVDHTVAGDKSDYVQITSTVNGSPTEGNYVEFSGLESDSFYVRIEGQTDVHGAALNGFEIVPEPATMAILGLGGVAVLIRRRRRIA
ncbi:MAG: PEP-CTERM sorting domain-containing protein [Phycisphaerae bacterium]